MAEQENQNTNDVQSVNEPSKLNEGTLSNSNESLNGNKQGNESLKDKHGEDAINRGRYDRDMKAKDAEIAKLKKELEESSDKAKSGEDALKQITELKAELADEKVSGALKLAGCVNEKAAKALLEDYENDVSKLKEACPYLFGGNAAARQTGITGAKQSGATESEDWIDDAFGLK